MNDVATHGWLARLREQAAERARALGLPTQALEDWRYVDVAALAAPPSAARGAVTAADVAARAMPGAALLVIADGVPRADLSDAAGVDALPLGRLPDADADALAVRWRDCTATASDIGACWSISDGGDGWRLRCRGMATRPVHLLCISSGGVAGGRVQIELGRGAALDLVVSHAQLGSSRLSLGVEIDLAEGARLRVDELQTTTTDQLLSLWWPRLQRDAGFSYALATIGGRLVRHRMKAVLQQSAAELRLAGAAVVGDQRQAHQLLRVVHAKGPTSSEQFFRTVARDRARCSFDGLVRIEHGADGAAAAQRNDNLLLSATARVDTRPQLDILADDVTASHGATVGAPVEDEVFYLQSRGLPRAAAVDLITRGFVREAIDRLHQPWSRGQAQRLLGGL